MKHRILLILSDSECVIAVNETPCQQQSLVTAILVFAISSHAVPRNAFRLLLFTGLGMKFCHFLETRVDGPIFVPQSLMMIPFKHALLPSLSVPCHCDQKLHPHD